jgi:hypothetical protein
LILQQPHGGNKPYDLPTTRNVYAFLERRFL